MNTSILKPKSVANKPLKTTFSIGIVKSVIDGYLDYCLAQGKEKVYWYMKAIIIIPCVIMVPSISAIYATGVPHEYYAGLCMFLFFANILAHVAQASSRLYIPLYHLTVVLMIAIPAVTYLISIN